MSESIQHKLTRNRPPRVHITYDMHKEGAQEIKEIPFVAGVLADLSGDNTPEKDLKEREFEKVDRDNFNNYFKREKPKLELDNIELAPGETSNINIEFSSVDDFHPDQLLTKILKTDDDSNIGNSLRKLDEIRNLLLNFKDEIKKDSSVTAALDEIIANTVKYHKEEK